MVLNLEDIEMAYLDGLKVVTAVKNTQLSPTLVRQARVIEKLYIQMECAKAKAEGRDHFVTNIRSVKSESGEKGKTEHVQKIRPWWYRNAEGNLVFEVRYANKRIELAKGKTGIEVALSPAIELLIKAVENGELDKSLGVVTTNFRAKVAK
jgi:hypothetical protein